MKNRPSYYYEDIVTLNKIDLDRITVKKINFSKYSVSKIRYNMSETREKPLRILINNACGKFLKLGVKVFLKVVVKPTILAIFKEIS